MSEEPSATTADSAQPAVTGVAGKMRARVWGRWLGGLGVVLAAGMLLASVMLPLDLARQVPLEADDGSPLGTELKLVEHPPTAVLDETATDEGFVLAVLAVTGLVTGLLALGALRLPSLWRGPVAFVLALTYGLVLAGLVQALAIEPLGVGRSEGVAAALGLLGLWGVAVAAGLLLSGARAVFVTLVAAAAALGLAGFALLSTGWQLLPLAGIAGLAAATTIRSPAWVTLGLFGLVLGAVALLLVLGVSHAGEEVWPSRWLHWRLALGTLGALLLAATGAAEWLLAHVVARRSFPSGSARGESSG